MINENEKLSLTQCKKSLERDGSVYTDAQVIAIRDFLYRMAEWDYEVYLKLKKRDGEFEPYKQNHPKQDDSQDQELEQAA
jgi:hypothetical protein